MEESLKGLIPVLAKAVDMTPAALYERQRALVRGGLLHGKPGRGPGSGVRATPQSVATLLIALLATGSLSETESQAKTLIQLKSSTRRCPLTGKATFGAALTAALASEELAHRVGWINVERGGAKAGASILFKKTQEERRAETDKLNAQMDYEESQFGDRRMRFKSTLSVRATLTLRFDLIAKSLTALKTSAQAR